MDPKWYIVIIAWTAILGFLLWLGIHEWRKTPEQKQADRDKARARYEARKAAEKQAKQQPPPSKNYGCLYDLASNSLFLLLIAGGLVFALFLLILND